MSTEATKSLLLFGVDDERYNPWLRATQRRGLLPARAAVRTLPVHTSPCSARQSLACYAHYPGTCRYIIITSTSCNTSQRDQAMPIQSKAKPVKIAASEWQTPDQALRGLFEGKDVQTGITFIRYVTDTVGEGPILHVHPYDEVFTIQEGRARFTIGNETIDAEAGDIVFGPANIPHGYQNLGPGRLDSLDIHLSPEWIQFDLAESWDESGVLVSAASKVSADSDA